LQKASGHVAGFSDPLVDCKKCLKRKIQYKQEQEIAIEQSCDDMEGFVKFMENKK